MTKDDLLSVMRIEEKSFPIAPWNRGASFLNGKQGRSFVVDEGDGRVVGYLVFKLGERSKVIEAVLVKMASDPAERRRGIGRFILTWVRATAVREKVHRIFLRVRKSNDAARGLYEREGFTTVRAIRDYYQSGETADEKTAVEMQKTVP